MFIDNDSILENFMKSPGLQHLAEKIFVDLDYQNLEACGKVNKTFQTSCKTNRVTLLLCCSETRCPKGIFNLAPNINNAMVFGVVCRI